MSQQPFTRRTSVLLSVVIVISLLGGFLISIFADEFRPIRSARADAFSTSAIGHKAFAELLRRFDFPVLVSRTRHQVTEGSTAAWILAEPRFLESGRLSGAFEQRFELCDRALLVLPKRDGRSTSDNSDWLASADLVSSSRVEVVLEAAQIAGAIVRRGAQPTAWVCPPGWPAPDLQDVQLIESDQLQPLISCPEGVLLGLIDEDDSRRTRLVLADPDLIATHGLVRGDNAELALQIARKLTPAGNMVVFDETLHGHVIERSLWKSYLAFPLALTSLHVVLTVAVFLLAAMVRFGSAQKLPAQLAAGKKTLIDNFANLLLVTGNSQYVLRRYLRNSIRSVAGAYHIQADMAGQELHDRLDTIATSRGLETQTKELIGAVRSAQAAGTGRTRMVVAAARQIRRWKQKMLYGPR
jgi:hypothetical protein